MQKPFQYNNGSPCEKLCSLEPIQLDESVIQKYTKSWQHHCDQRGMTAVSQAMFSAATEERETFINKV